MSLSKEKSLPLISVIIVTWNGKRYALECLASLRSCRLADSLEIIVVDNASSDGTPEAIRTQFPEVILIENSGNLGFAKANNLGMARSRGQYVCLVNSDVVVYPGCLEQMLEVMEQHPDIGVLGPRMICADGSIGGSVMRRPTVWNSLCAALALHAIWPHSSVCSGYGVDCVSLAGLEDVEVLGGWFLLVPRAALEQVGGLDERFFMYAEDIDWSYRFAKAGWRVVYCAEAESLHYGGASSAEAPVRCYVAMRQANLQYFLKHSGTYGGIGYGLAVAVHESARIAGYSLAYFTTSRRRQEKSAKIRRSVACLRWLAGACVRANPLSKPVAGAEAATDVLHAA
jgi:GT2 family glycosyltransferase